MFVLVVGGGKVGYYLAKELIELGPRGRAHGEGPGPRGRRSPTRSARSSSPTTAARASTSAEAGCNRADIVAAVTGDDEDNLVICQMAKHHFDVPRTIARVNNPKNEELFRHLGVDEIDQPDPDDPGLDRAGHPGPRAAPPGRPRRRRARADRGAAPGRLAGGRPSRRATCRCPRAARSSRSSATSVAISVRPDTVLRRGRQGDRHRQRPSARRSPRPARSASHRAEEPAGSTRPGPDRAATAPGPGGAECQSSCRVRSHATARLLTMALSGF